MQTYPGTDIPTGQSSRDRINTIVDQLLNPRILMFRAICIFDEEGALTSDGGHWKWSYGNWNESFELIFRKNGKVMKPGTFQPFYGKGWIKDTGINVGPDDRPRDAVELTYQFDYFPVEVLEGIIDQSVDFVNTAAVGPPTFFTADNMPDYWLGVVTDASFAVCMERLILDYTLWKGRLIFALGPNEIEGGGGDIVGQLETLKSNAESRVSRTIENERFKLGNWVSPPTQVYFNAVRGIGGGTICGPHGSGPYGRLRGWKRNKIYGG